MVLASSFVLIRSQTPNTNEKQGSEKITNGTRGEKLRDLSFSNGVDLQFIIKELAREMDLNVVFDPQSFGSPGRKTTIDIKSVTAATALNLILLQERLIAERVEPGTIIVASQYQVTMTPHFGLVLWPLSEQLAEYFGVGPGLLVTNVREDSAGWIAGLKAGDVIIRIDEKPIVGALGLIRAFNEKKGGDVTLQIVRDRKELTLNLTLDQFK